jgi:ferric-dicitrate binding protein FerR (iron transport regulator)
MAKDMISWDLIKRWLDGHATADEELFLQEWSGKNRDNKRILDELSRRWAGLKDDQFDTVEALKKLRHKIRKTSSAGSAHDAARITFGHVFLKIAASLALIVSLASLWYFHSNTSVSEEIEYFTKTTKANQRAIVTLSDGSTVKLNTRSSLTYPKYFQSDVREVTLTGEAYFQVKKSAERPFIVKSGNITTTVLGTSFNVRAFKDKDIEVTVESGKVNVSSQNEFSLDLARGQQAIYQRGAKKLLFREVDPGGYLAWFERKLQFDRISFGDVLTQIERIYNVDIYVERDYSNQCMVRVMYEGEQLENVLKGLQLVVDFDYRYQNDSTIIVAGKGCIE